MMFCIILKQQETSLRKLFEKWIREEKHCSSASYFSSKKNSFFGEKKKSSLSSHSGKDNIFFLSFIFFFQLILLFQYSWITITYWDGQKWGFLKYQLHKNNIWPQFYCFFKNSCAISIVQKLISFNLIPSVAELASMSIGKGKEYSLFLSNILKSFVSFKWK